MSIQSDFAAYTNALGFVSNAPNGSSGNDLLISAEAQLVLQQNGALDPQFVPALCYSIVKSAQITSGLYGRPGWMQDQEAADDYYGLCYIYPGIARSILSYGKSCWWSRFKTSSNATWFEPLFWRWPALICHAHWASGNTPNWFLRVWWAGCVALSGDGTQQDPWKLSRMLVEVAGNKGWLERWATAKFWSRLKASYGSMKGVYTAYYGAQHPIAQYCKD